MLVSHIHKIHYAFLHWNTEMELNKYLRIHLNIDKTYLWNLGKMVLAKGIYILSYQFPFLQQLNVPWDGDLSLIIHSTNHFSICLYVRWDLILRFSLHCYDRRRSWKRSQRIHKQYIKTSTPLPSWPNNSVTWDWHKKSLMLKH